MASPAQVLANQANAEKSTGPTSDSGKNTSRTNARRSGIHGQVTTMPDAERAIFDSFTNQLLVCLAPTDALELSLANAIAWDTWRLNQLRAHEMNLYALHMNESESTMADLGPDSDPGAEAAMANAQTFANEGKTFQRLSLYEQRLNRSLHKNREAYRQMKAEAKVNRDRERNNEILLARCCEIKGLTYQPTPPEFTNGFVFSNDEISYAAARQTALELAEQAIRTHFKAEKRPRTAQNPTRNPETSEFPASKAA